MAEGFAQYKSKWARIVLGVVLAFFIASGSVFAQQGNCSGPQLMNIYMGFQALAICGIFGPVACGGYTAIVLSYQMVVWMQSGC